MTIALSGCGSSVERPAADAPSGTSPQQTGSTQSTGVPAGTVTSSSATATAAPEFPPAVAPLDLEHGGTYWGVYVAVVHAGDNLEVAPEDQERLDAAERSLTGLGYEPDAGAYDLGCEQGMVEQLRLDPHRHYATVRIFFTTQARAEQFVVAYQPGVVGTAKVTLYCMD